MLNAYAFLYIAKTQKTDSTSEPPAQPAIPPVEMRPEEPPLPPGNIDEEVPETQLSRRFPSELSLPTPSAPSTPSSPVVIPDVASVNPATPLPEVAPTAPTVLPPPPLLPPRVKNSPTVTPVLEFWGFDEEELNKQIVSKPASVDNAPLSLPQLSLPPTIDSAVANKTPGPESSEAEEIPRMIEVRKSESGKNYFYNIPVTGPKVLFILEASSRITSGMGGQVLSLENELKRVINALDANQRFNIWVFQEGRISLCEPDYMEVNNANKAFSLLWLRGHYQNIHKQQIIEDNKPDGYPEDYLSKSGLDWAEPLFLGMHSYPDEIFLIASSWQEDAPAAKALDAIRFWTREKQNLWRSAYEETTNWLEEENRARKAQGLPPRAVISVGSLVAKRHPNVEAPPRVLQTADGGLIRELDEIAYARGLENRLSLNTILYSLGTRGKIEDIHKFSSLSRQYLGQFVLVEGDGIIREF